MIIKKSFWRQLLETDPTESARFVRGRIDQRDRDLENWTVTFNVAGQSGIQWEVPGRDDETNEVLTENDVREMVIAFFDERSDELGSGEWRWLRVRIDGRYTLLVFRGSWVAGFTLDPNRPEDWR